MGCLGTLSGRHGEAPGCRGALPGRSRGRLGGCLDLEVVGGLWGGGGGLGTQHLTPHAQHHRNSMVSHRHRDSRVPSMQKSSSAPLRRRLAYLLPLHHRHRWRTHHPRSPPTLLVPHHWPWRHLTWGVVGPTRPRGAWEGVGRAVGRVGTAHREVFSHMHGTFGVPLPLHCPCRSPSGALPALHNTLVHRLRVPRRQLFGRPLGRFDVKRRAPTPLASGELRARGHSAASRHGIETG